MSNPNQRTESVAVLAVWLVLILAALPVMANDTDKSPQSAALEGLQWRLIGPANMGGRVTDIVGVPGDPKTFYLGGADGGVFKTTNGGVTFEALFTDQRAYSVGALALAPSDPNVIWLGSGEGDPRNSVGYGNGVYRSLNGGKTWTHLGLDDSERIKRIVVDPRDPDTAYVCALGHAWGPNAERGVFKTSDGGQSWEKSLYKDQDTGCSDLALELGNPRILYAGMWTFRRRPWRFDDGGKETALYRSMDAGKSWEKLEDGLPKGPLARIGVSIAQSRPGTVYMITESVDEGTLFRSDDRGDNWYRVNSSRNINFRPFYYSDIRVDPSNPDHIYSLSGGLYKSTDGGRNFDRIGRGVHGDHQSLWIDPQDSDRVLSGSDGGFQISYDAGATFDILNNLALSQFYHIHLNDADPYSVCGGLQDNGTWCGPSHSLHSAGILKKDWFKLTGGDGYFAVPVPGRPHQLFTNLQGGVIFFTDLNQGLTRTIHPYPKITGSAGDAIAEHRYRFNWDSPIHISPHDPDIVYFGGNVLFKSSDQGHSWEEISPDLTTNDKSKQLTSGGEIYQDNTAAEFHCTLLTISESPLEAGVIWAGTDDGNIQLTRNGGKSWTNLKDNLPGLPAFSWISRIDASSHSKGVAFVAVDRHRSDDFRPYIYKTADYGQTWQKITGGLPEDDYVKVVRQDPRNPDLLYAGLEHGIYASWDGGENWHSIRNNLPPVSVRDLRIHPREHDLVVGTHGRGVWILDDIRPLQDLASALDKDMHLFPVRSATRWQVRNSTANRGQRVFTANNPPNGAAINFYLKEAPQEEEPEAVEDVSTNGDQQRPGRGQPPAVRVSIEDSSGQVIFQTQPRDLHAGINRIVWGLRRDAPGSRQGAGFRGGRGAAGRPRGRQAAGRFGRGSRGPRVVPGEYTVVLRLGQEALRTPVTIRPDPRVQARPEDYQAQYESAWKLAQLGQKVETVIRRIGQIDQQLTSLQSTLRANSGGRGQEETPLPSGLNGRQAMRKISQGKKAFQAFLDDMLKRPMDGLGYRQRPRLREEIRSLMFAIDGSAGRPTRPQINRIGELEGEASQAVQEYEQLHAQHVEALNKMLKDLPAVVAGKVEGGS